MEIRSITPAEYEETRNIQTIAFGSKNENDDETQEGKHRYYRAVFENGKACACLESFPFKAILNGNLVGMSGIGGVASLPEKRRKGFVRELFHNTMEESRKNGDAVSYLFPFSHVFYRQFGYETCMIKNKTAIPLSAFEKSGDDGFATMFLPGSDEMPIRQLYESYAADKNLMTLRSEEKWVSVLGNDPYTSRTYLYIWHNAEGKPLGYVIFSAEDCADTANMSVKELIWTSSEGLRGLLGFLRGFTAKYSMFLYRAPEFLNFRLLVKEPFAVGSQGLCNGMGRVVDVARALETLKMPESKKRVSIRVHDDFLSWNDGCFALYSEGVKTLVEKTDAAPDMEVDVRTLMQLVSSYASAEDCLYANSAIFYSHQDLFSRLFKKGRVFIIDEF